MPLSPEPLVKSHREPIRSVRRRGVVPMEAFERQWRERHGTFLQQLARKAERVTRVFCGLTEELK